MDDVNDLIQDTYVELYKILKKKKLIVLENEQNYIIGIAKKKLQRHYGLLYRFHINNKLEQQEYESDIPSNVDIEADTIRKLNVEEVWKYIHKKNVTIIKIFYLYYCLELKISQIANELDLTESNVKNLLYRTIKEIKKNVKIEGDTDV